MPMPDIGSRVRIVQVEEADLEKFIGSEGAIVEFMDDNIMVKLDGLPFPMKFTTRDVRLI